MTTVSAETALAPPKPAATTHPAPKSLARREPHREKKTVVKDSPEMIAMQRWLDLNG
jgi:hypothetical protein